MLDAGNATWNHAFRSFSQYMPMGKRGKALVTHMLQMKRDPERFSYLPKDTHRTNNKDPDSSCPLPSTPSHILTICLLNVL